ncbi:Glucose-regulated protein 94 [Fasciola gigantica]|uniref:Glucose-regulated protein 94 n=1 Tax=Fasciola gigantica TaxID=46835 RepID=A0A504Z041_FASGI|nr:Glucose-regulated protein 94 [Fasciola gigantica]
MGRSGGFFLVCVVGILAIIACVFGDAPSGEGTAKVEKPNEGLSTAKDTLKEESESIFVDGLNASEIKALRDAAEKHEFQAEVLRMMQLIINSLYKNKEIFLRELISNASDALDKIRMISLTNETALKATDELAIRIKVNKDTRTLHIIDTGIGMTKKELAANLGTIAKSGTSEFKTNVTESGDSADATDLIGQFGVGFYSSFLVSKRVTVISKSNDDKQYIWESDSQSFTLVEDPRGDTLKRGTEIILHLSDEADDYLQVDTLKDLIKKYSQFVNFPIHLWCSRVEKVPEESAETQEGESKDEASVEEEKKSEPKMVEKTVWEWVHINKQKPIWKRKPSDITDDEYKGLYHALSNDEEDPLGKLHFTAEGDVTFTSVVFIPKRSQGDVFNPNYSYKDRIKLHVHRVFITDAAEDLIPKYLGFVRGIVDSDDLPINVSRETLQQSQLVKLIKKKIVRRIIDAISKLSEKDYEKFWQEYSVHIKLGMLEDSSNKVRLSKLLRFRTSKSSEKPVSLAEYVGRMKKDQTAIYYLSGASLNEVQKSPLAERLIKKDIEVVYMIDPLDEYLVQSFNEFDGKPLQSVAKEGVVLDASEKSRALKEAQNKEYENLLKWLKEEALKGSIEKAELSERLSESPCALVASTYGWSGNMERILRAQAHHKGDDSSTDYYWKMPKTLEINPRHPLIKELNSRVKADSSDNEAKQTAQLLFYVATLRSGYTIQDSVDFAKKIEIVMRKNLAVDENEKVEEELEEKEESTGTENKATDEELEEKKESADTESKGTDEELEEVEPAGTSEADTENNSSSTDRQADTPTEPKDEL